MKKSIGILVAVLVLLFTAACGGFFALTFLGEKEQPKEIQETTPVTPVAVDNSVVEIWDAVNGTVVGITNIPAQSSGQQSALSNVGSGVVVDSRGYIITNFHVINGAETLYVTLSDQSQKTAEIIGTDARTDLALLKIEGSDYPVASLGDSDSLKVGETAVAIGNPGGLDFASSATTGIISGLNRPLTTEEGLRFKLIQTDAAINPGNSGGALVNGKGEVIGINTIKISQEGFEGMGFAIPSNLVKDVVAALMEQGKVTRAALGVYLLGSVGREYAADPSRNISYGVVISPQKGGAGAAGGLLENDVIIAVDDNKIMDIYELQDVMFSHKVGDTVSVTVMRNGKSQSFSVVLGELKEE